jgi:ribosomal protein S18 acetylase RimI-like enzyme
MLFFEMKIASFTFLAILYCTHGYSFMSIVSPLTDKTKSIKVYPARIPEDLKAIQECRQTSFVPGQRMLESDRSFLNADSASKKAVVCLVAKESVYPWRVLGSADIRVNTQSREAAINNVFVRPEARGKGLGRRLMNEAQEYAQATGGVNKLSLDVSTQNTAAFNLYRQLGFSAPGIHALVSALGESFGLNLQVTMTKKI